MSGAGGDGGWDSDPALQALRNEFIASFAARARELAAALEPFSPSRVQTVAHRLAGAAASYGFALLGEAAGALDDLIEHDAEGQATVDELRGHARFLGEVLLEAARAGEDPARFRDDPRLAALIAAAGDVL